MLAILAELDRNQISQRTTVAMGHSRVQGRFPGLLPFGFDLAADGETLIKNPDELKVVVLIQSLMQGIQPAGNCQTMETAQIRTTAGKLTWTHTAVQ